MLAEKFNFYEFAKKQKAYIELRIAGFSICWDFFLVTAI